MEDQFQIINNERTGLGGLTIKDIFFKYIRFLPLILLSIALALFAGYLYLRYAIPIYHSTGSLVINGDNNSSGGNENDKFQKLFVGGAKEISNEIEIMKSKPLMVKVVEDLNLNFSYYLKGKVKDENRYNNSSFKVEPLSLSDSNASFALKINFTKDGFTLNDEKPLLSFGQVFKNQYGKFRIIKDPSIDLSGQEYKVVWQSSPAVAYNLIANLLVAPKGATGILIISLEAGNPQMAADVINQLMNEYQIATIEDKNETARQTIQFIDSRLIEVSRELDSVNQQLLSYQVANNLIFSDAQSAEYFTSQTETDKEISSQQLRLSIAQMIDDYLRNSENNFTTTPSTLIVDDPTLSTLIAAYNAAQLERRALIDANVPETNPRVQQKEDQIEKLRENILENLRIVKTSYTTFLNKLRQKSSLVQSEIRALPQKELNLLKIKKEQEARQALYNLLNEKREESAISLAGTISNTKVIEPAVPNNAPVKPDRRNVQMIAFLAGLAIPALIIFLIEVLNDKITSRAEIEKLTTIPIIGEIGHSYKHEILIARSHNRGFIAEQFRIVRSNLQYVINNFQKPVILVTSSFSGEGKSFLSMNLGAVMALANKKTIILEFDIRKPKILSHLKMPKRPGLTNYLLGKISVEELPVKVPELDNLYVLPCGPVPPNPAELLLDPKMNQVFAFLKENFEVIVIDTAPVGMVSDAMTLSRFADTTMYIIRQGYTYKKQLGLIEQYHQEGKLPKMSILINDVERQAGYGYGGYGKYVYAAGSDYFDNETPEPTFLQRWFGLKVKTKANKV